jgi:hypothetical protein
MGAILNAYGVGCSNDFLVRLYFGFSEEKRQCV